MPLTTDSAGALVRGAKGWFAIDGVQPGDRTLDEQLLGLDAIAPAIKGRTVLDLGCAEGLILKHCVEAWGASGGAGVSIVPTEIMAARGLCAGLPIALHQADLNAPWPIAMPHDGFGVILALSILHKLADPAQALRRLAVFAADDGVVAIRLPSPIIHDARSGWRTFDVRPAMVAAGFALVAEPATCRGEWLGIYRRG